MLKRTCQGYLIPLLLRIIQMEVEFRAKLFELATSSGFIWPRKDLCAFEAEKFQLVSPML